MEFLKHAALKRVILNHCQGPGQWFMHVCYPSTRTWVWILSNSNKKIQNGSKCPSPLPFESGDGWAPEGHWPASLTKLMGFNFSKTPCHKTSRGGPWKKGLISGLRAHTAHTRLPQTHKEIQTREPVLLRNLEENLSKWMGELICWAVSIALILLFLLFSMSFALLRLHCCDRADSHWLNII